MNVIDLLIPNIEQLRGFSEDLESTLSCIAYAGLDKNKKWIKHRQKELTSNYQNEIEGLGKIAIYSEIAGIIIDAYDKFNDILNLPKNRLIDEEAKEILNCYLMSCPEYYKRDIEN